MAIRFFVFGFFSALSRPSQIPRHTPSYHKTTRTHTRAFPVTRSFLSHSIPLPPSTHNPTVSRRFFSLARPPRLPPPDTRSTVLIFHRRGNRWPDKKISRSTTFLSFFLVFIIIIIIILITQFTRTYLKIDFD